MERRSFVRHAGLAGVLAAGSAPALVNAQQKIRWRLASSFPKQLDSIYGAAETVSKKLAEMSGGAFQLTVYASGEIVPPFNVMDAVSSGTVECGHTASYYYWAKNEAFALSCAIPFGMTSRQLTAWMMDGNGLKLLRELFVNVAEHDFALEGKEQTDSRVSLLTGIHRLTRRAVLSHRTRLSGGRGVGVPIG